MRDASEVTEQHKGGLGGQAADHRRNDVRAWGRVDYVHDQERGGESNRTIAFVEATE